MSRLSLAAFLSLALAAYSAVPALAQTTTIVTASNSPYTIPGNTIASGDRVIVQNGGTLNTGSMVALAGTLELAPTTAGGTMSYALGISGSGTVVKTGNGTVNLGIANQSFSGTWRLESGTVTSTLTNAQGGESSQKLMGNSTTLTLAGGFLRSVTNENFSIGNKAIVITPDGGGFDFSGATADRPFVGISPSVGSLGITGTGVFTIRGTGSASATSGMNNPPWTMFNAENVYSGTTILQGGVYVFNPMTYSSGSSAFGTSTVQLEQNATLTSNLNSTTLGNSQNVLRMTNTIALGAGGGQLRSTYTNSSQFNTIELAGPVSGTGSLSVLAGSAMLSGSNTFTGDTRLGTVSTNMLTLNNVNALAGSTLDMNAADAGSLQLISSNTYYKLGGLKGSRTLLQPTGLAPTNVSLPANVALDIGSNNQDTTFTGNFGQQGARGYDGIIKSGTGTLTLTGTYFTNTSPVVSTPGIQITGGVLAVNSDRALGVSVSTGTVNTVPVTLNGGTLRQSTTLSLPRPITLATNGGGLDTTPSAASDTPAFTGVISGTGNLRLIANGSLTGTSTGGMSLSGVNTYTGTTTITAGAVQAQSSFGTASNQVVLDGGALLAAGGTRANTYATRIGQATGSLRAAAASDVLNQSGVVSGSGGLRVSGNGTVNLQSANTFSGDTRVLTGTLNVAHANGLQSSLLDLDGADTGLVGFTAGTTTYNVGGLQGSRNLAFSSGTLSVGSANLSTTYSGVISGVGRFEKAGTGSLTLSGSNSYSGGTTVSGGRLIGTTSSLQGAITNNAEIEFAQAAAGSYAGNMTGSGSLTKSGAGDLTLSGTNNYSGGTTVSAGRLVGTASSIQGSVTNNAAVEFAQATAGTYSGAMTGNGGFIKSGAGALTLTAASSYGGTTDVQAGTLVVNANNVGVTGPITLASGATLAGNGTHGGAIVLNAGSTLSPGNSPGTFTTASGTWAGGANYNWQLVDAAGTAGTDWDLLDVTGSLDITATTGSPFNINLWTLSGTGPDVNGNASNFTSNGNYSWKIATAAGGVTGFASNKFQVNTSATNGTAGFANSFGSGQFSVANTGNDVNVVFTPAVVFDVTSGTQTQTQQGASANIASAISVTKTGAGAVVMSGNNTYSAATTVSAGSLIVTGTLSDSDVTVEAAAVLAGDGLVGQLVTIANGGTLSPGAAPTDIGILELGSLALSSTATTVLSIMGTTPGTGFDQIKILGAGSLTYGGFLNLSTSNIDGAVAGTTYRLFDFSGSPTGSFSSLSSLGGAYSSISWGGPVGGVWTSSAGSGGTYLTFTEVTGTLGVVAAVPEPSTLALAGIAIACCYAGHRRRRAAASRFQIL